MSKVLLDWLGPMFEPGVFKTPKDVLTSLKTFSYDEMPFEMKASLRQWRKMSHLARVRAAKRLISSKGKA